MNKNLKKVISTVAALAISASAVSAFAVNFPDVPEDASYAQAVQELSALGVVSGFDDGTFRPDELVTRAQMAKMIVDALNETEQAEASKANTQFTDVTDHWAKGYINQGVSDTFISGYGDGTFGPDDNVTYVQAQSMLVRAIGYQTYAEGSGGWPNGYKTWAASQGITAGISGIADDTQLTRAQVAQLVDNTMGSPVCVVKDYDTTIDGRRVPNLEIKDDEGKDYQTLFTKKHDTYKVYGRVTKTSKTDNLDSDKVEFTVEKADNFNDQWIGTAKNADETTITEEMYYGDTKAPDYLLTYSQALIQKDSNDEYTIISISPAASTKSITLAAEDFDADKTKTEVAKVINGKYPLYFYPAGTTRNSQKYTVDTTSTEPEYKVYVNGVEAPALADIDNLVEYIKDNDTAAITLEKQTKTGSTSATTDYTLVNITTYQTAVVSDVVAKTDKVTIYFDSQEGGIGSNLAVELDNEDITYDFTLDGAAIDPADIQEDDVLSIAYEANNWKDSNFYDVIVSRNVVEEVQCTSTSSTDNEYTFDNGETYKAIEDIVGKNAIDMTSTYVLYLDHFNRIAKTDENTANKKIAILKNVYKKAGGDWYVQIVTKEGAEEEYKVDDTKRAEFQAVLKHVDAETGEADYTGEGNSKVDLYPQQVIEYSVSSSTNKITLKDTLTGEPTTGKEEYRASSSKLGGIKFNDATVVLDISEADDDEFDVVSADALVDGNYYEGFGFDQTKTGTKYHRFVILTSGLASYNSETQMAVIMKIESVNDDGETKPQFKLAVNGDEETHIVDEDKAGSVKNFAEGDAVIYKTNGSGHITDIIAISNNRWLTGNWSNFIDDVLVETDASAFIKTLAPNGDKWQDYLEDGNSSDVNFIFGVVANKNGSNVTISMPGAFKTGDGNVAAGIDYDAKAAEYSLSGAKLYAYNFAASTSKGASKVSLDEGVLSTTKVTKAEKTGVADGDNKSYVNHTILDLEAVDADNNALFEENDYVFAVARVDDDEVQEILFIYND